VPGAIPCLLHLTFARDELGGVLLSHGQHSGQLRFYFKRAALQNSSGYGASPPDSHAVLTRAGEPQQQKVSGHERIIRGFVQHSANRSS